MTLEQIKSSIAFGKFSFTELREIGQALQYAQSQLTKTVRNNVMLGDNVNWVSNKNPNGNCGTVVKIGRKFVDVRTASGTVWKVPANMLNINV